MFFNLLLLACSRAEVRQTRRAKAHCMAALAAARQGSGPSSICFPEPPFTPAEGGEGKQIAVCFMVSPELGRRCRLSFMATPASWPGRAIVPRQGGDAAAWAGRLRGAASGRRAGERDPRPLRPRGGPILFIGEICKLDLRTLSKRARTERSLRWSCQGRASCPRGPGGGCALAP